MSGSRAPEVRDLGQVTFCIEGPRGIVKPAIAVAGGCCIYAGPMLAAVMDLVSASGQAQFPGGFAEYNSIPWDLGFGKAKEICSGSRFMTAAECQAAGFASRVFPAQDPGRQARAFARRVAGNHPFTLRMTKLQVSKAQDAQGFRSLLQDSLGGYAAMMFMPGFSTIAEDTKRLRAAGLAVRGRRGERYGQDGTHRQT